MKKACRSGFTFAILVYVFVFSYSPASKGAAGEPKPGSLAAVFEKNLGQAPGHTLLYSTYLGGSSRNYGNAIGVDASGNIIVAGTSASNDFPHAGSVPSLTCQGNNDCFFLVSLKSDGSAFNYARLIGGIEGTDAQSGGGPGAGNIAVDAAGNTFLTGRVAAGFRHACKPKIDTVGQPRGEQSLPIVGWCLSS